MDIIGRIKEHYQSICWGYLKHVDPVDGDKEEDREKQKIDFIKRLEEGILNTERLIKNTEARDEIERAACYYSDTVSFDLSYFRIAAKMFIESWGLENKSQKRSFPTEEWEVLKALVGPDQIFAEILKNAKGNDMAQVLPLKGQV